MMTLMLTLHALGMDAAQLLSSRFSQDVRIEIQQIQKLSSRPAEQAFVRFIKAGQAHLAVPGEAEVIVHYKAHRIVWAAHEKIERGARLSQGLFDAKDVLIADPAFDQGFAYFDLAHMRAAYEATQTILPGQMLTASAVTKVPDVRIGDKIRVTLIGAGLRISTEGVALEKGWLYDSLRASVAHSKKQMRGTLVAPHELEVNL